MKSLFCSGFMRSFCEERIQIQCANPAAVFYAIPDSPTVSGIACIQKEKYMLVQTEDEIVLGVIRPACMKIPAWAYLLRRWHRPPC
jgi:hypothetical protein